LQGGGHGDDDGEAVLVNRRGGGEEVLVDAGFASLPIHRDGEVNHIFEKQRAL
jgi:hypothetical protein